MSRHSTKNPNFEASVIRLRKAADGLVAQFGGDDVAKVASQAVERLILLNLLMVQGFEWSKSKRDLVKLREGRAKKSSGDRRILTKMINGPLLILAENILSEHKRIANASQFLDRTASVFRPIAKSDPWLAAAMRPLWMQYPGETLARGKGYLEFRRRIHRSLPGLGFASIEAVVKPEGVEFHLHSIGAPSQVNLLAMFPLARAIGPPRYRLLFSGSKDQTVGMGSAGIHSYQSAEELRRSILGFDGFRRSPRGRPTRSPLPKK